MHASRQCERILLCRPQGGLNDILCTIERARRYAEKYDRVLFVDTNYVNTDYIKDDFSNYFKSKDKIVHLNSSPIARKLVDLTIFPYCVADKVNRYHAYYDFGLGNFAEQDSRQRISFNFDVDYAEQLLVLHACGGGRGLGVSLLSRLQLSDDLADQLARRLNTIGGPYLGVHIRHTDYKCDYERSLALLKPRLLLDTNCNNLFVATDNIDCLNHCKALFSPFNIFSFSSLPKVAGTPIHYRPDTSNRFQENADAILDVVMLALAKSLFPLPLAPGQPVLLSGFSILACELRNNPVVLERLAPSIFASVNFVRTSQTMGTRNAICSCGSGKHYKHCCGLSGSATSRLS